MASPPAVRPQPLARTAQRAISTELIEKVRAFADNALSERTRHRYDQCWRAFEAWCGSNGRIPLPADSDTLIAYIAWLADGQGKGKPLAASSINQAVSALKAAHRMSGVILNTKDDAAFQVAWTGTRRTIAKERTIRRVSPFTADDLRDALEMLRPDVLREARDAALLSLGWGAARRRSELVGLDWQKRGTGTGILIADERGLVVTLMTSKTKQEGGEEYIVPRMHAPFLCSKIEEWIALGKIEPGSPVFRPIAGNTAEGNRVKPERLNARSVPRIVNCRIALLLKARNKGRRKQSAADLKAAVDAYAGHSLRVGHVSSAADRGVPAHHIKKQTGHTTDTMISLYSRVADTIKHSSLKGSGL